MALSDWNKIVIENTGNRFWVKFRNERNKREIHVANQVWGKKYYVGQAWLTHKYKLFDTKIQALVYAREYMRKH